MDMKDEWRYVLEGSGEQSVKISGTTMKLKLHADSLDLEQLVNVHHNSVSISILIATLFLHRG